MIHTHLWKLGFFPCSSLIFHDEFRIPSTGVPVHNSQVLIPATKSIVGGDMGSRSFMIYVDKYNMIYLVYIYILYIYIWIYYDILGFRRMDYVSILKQPNTYHSILVVSKTFAWLYISHVLNYLLYPYAPSQPCWMRPKGIPYPHPYDIPLSYHGYCLSPYVCPYPHESRCLSHHVCLNPLDFCGFPLGPRFHGEVSEVTRFHGLSHHIW